MTLEVLYEGIKGKICISWGMGVTQIRREK